MKSSSRIFSNCISAGRTHLRSRRLIQLSGPDSAHYLQGAITANIGNPPRTTAFFAAFLNPKGRVLNDVFIYPVLSPNSTFSRSKWKHTGPGNHWVIEVDRDEAEGLVKHIQKYQLRAKFEVRVTDEREAAVYSIWNENDENGTAQGFASSVARSSSEPRDSALTAGCVDPRAPGMGKRVIVEAAETMEEVLGPDMEIPVASQTDYDLHRYLHGIAEGPQEILRGTALVQESNLDLMGAVDYRKGCYVGQELTIRTHHTGVVRKRIVPLMLYHAGEAVPERLEYRASTEKAEAIPPERAIQLGKTGKSVGKWLAGTGNLGLGLVRLNAVDGRGVGGADEGRDEFTIHLDDERGRSVRVEAFVPAWHGRRQM